MPVIRGRTNENAPPINASTITQLGFVLSRFSFNDLPNSNYKAGNFSLQVRPVAVCVQAHSHVHVHLTLEGAHEVGWRAGLLMHGCAWGHMFNSFDCS